MTTFSTECSQKLFCMLYRSKKEFDNFVMLYTNRKVAMLQTISMKKKMYFEKDLIFKNIVKISDLTVLHQITY